MTNAKCSMKQSNFRDWTELPKPNFSFKDLDPSQTKERYFSEGKSPLSIISSGDTSLSQDDTMFPLSPISQGTRGLHGLPIHWLSKSEYKSVNFITYSSKGIACSAFAQHPTCYRWDIPNPGRSLWVSCGTSSPIGHNVRVNSNCDHPPPLPSRAYPGHLTPVQLRIAGQKIQSARSVVWTLSRFSARAQVTSRKASGSLHGLRFVLTARALSSYIISIEKTMTQIAVQLPLLQS